MYSRGAFVKVDAEKLLWWRGKPRDSSSKLSAALVMRAVWFGDLCILKWLHSERLFDAKVKRSGQTAAHVAAYFGHLHFLQWMHAQGLLDVEELDDKDCNVAHLAESRGHAHILQWMQSRGLLNPGKDKHKDGDVEQSLQFQNPNKPQAEKRRHFFLQKHIEH